MGDDGGAAGDSCRCGPRSVRSEEADELTLRHAKPADVPRLEELIATSVRGLSIGYYTARQIESSIR